MLKLALVLLAACSARSTGPAWPTPHPTYDGGESLAPHEGNAVAAAVAAEGDDEVVPEVVAPPAVVITPAARTIELPIAPAAKPDEPIIIEEQVIEVDD